MGRAARADQFDANFVARAQDFERAAKQDVEQYRAWLDHYAAADQKDRLKHERRLRREQRRYRREVRLRYARRLIYRYTSAFLRFVRTTVSNHRLPVAANLLDRDFDRTLEGRVIVEQDASQRVSSG